MTLRVTEEKKLAGIIIMVALVQRPAPAFKATAVVEGQFKDVSLSDYKGQWLVSHNTFCGGIFFSHSESVGQGCSLLLPTVSHS